MKINDVVRVARQPKNQHTSLVGERAYIEELSNGFATIEAFSITGRATGCGTVPLDCLEPETSAVWFAALGVMVAERDRYTAEVLARQKLRQEQVALVAKAYGITPAQALEIHAALSDDR